MVSCPRGVPGESLLREPTRERYTGSWSISVAAGAGSAAGAAAGGLATAEGEGEVIAAEEEEEEEEDDERLTSHGWRRADSAERRWLGACVKHAWISALASALTSSESGACDPVRMRCSRPLMPTPWKAGLPWSIS